MKKIFKNLSSGFTIVESLVAITILVLAVTGAMSAIQSGISSYIFSKDQIIAFYLAQEGVENVRNFRDRNYLRNQHWLTGLASIPGDPCFFGGACIADSTKTPTFTPCSGIGSCPNLNQNSANGLFGYTSTAGWNETIFRREIILTQINVNEISVLVTVNWSKGLIPREFKARENIFNWQ